MGQINNFVKDFLPRLLSTLNDGVEAFPSKNVIEEVSLETYHNISNHSDEIEYCKEYSFAVALRGINEPVNYVEKIAEAVSSKFKSKYDFSSLRVYAEDNTLNAVKFSFTKEATEIEMILYIFVTVSNITSKNMEEV